MSATALDLITRACVRVNMYTPGENPSPNDSVAFLAELNMMVSGWAPQTQNIPVVSREVFDLEADKGGPDDPYTIGDGGDFDTIRPASQSSITGVGLLLLSTTPSVEIPRVVFTDDAWQNVQIKDLSNSLFTGLYYNPTYADSLGTINLWPVPDVATNDIVLYIQRPIAQFANLLTEYDFPDGYEDAIVSNLALRIADISGRVVTARMEKVARNSLAMLQRINIKMADLAVDVMWTSQSRKFAYNINQGNM